MLIIQQKEERDNMKTLGNVLWIIFGGLGWCIGCFLSGILLCCTIIGIPVGLQLFKFAKFVLLPFGKNVVQVNPTGFKKFVNIVYAILIGWEVALSMLLTGCLFCITIIGIPFGKQYFKMARFVLTPLGYDFA